MSQVQTGTHQRGSGPARNASNQRNDALQGSIATANYAANILPFTRSVRNEPNLDMKVERHSWECPSCSCSGDTITTQLTDRMSFETIIFRDHDLQARGSCKSSLVDVWPYGAARSRGWQILRNGS